MRWQHATIRAVAKWVDASPLRRRAIVAILDRAPQIKRRLKRSLFRSDAIAAQLSVTHVDLQGDDTLLSAEARRVLHDLRREHDRSAAGVTRSGPPVQ